jgi:MFS family permease
MSDPLKLLRNKNLRSYITSRFLLTLGLQMQFVAIQWQVYSLTKDPLSLGLIGLAEVIPAIGFALFAGHIVDRFNRRHVLLSALGVSAGVSILLWLLGSEIIHIDVSYKVYTMYFSVFVLGIARAFMAPASFAFFGEFMPREDFVRGSAWSSTAWQTAAALGPAIGGMLYGLSGPNFVYSLSFMNGLAGLLYMASIPGRANTGSSREPFMQSLSIGLKFVFRNQLVLSALSLDLFAVLFGGAVALLPMFADLLNTGPQGLGLLRAAPSVGAFFMALYFTQRPPVQHTGRILLSCVAGFGLCIIGFGLSRSFILSLFFLSVSGAFDAVSVIVRSAILQLTTPTEMRGRVSAVNSIFISSSNELGAFESGVTARWMGAVPAVVFGGCMTILVVGGTLLFAPKMRKLHLHELQKSAN